MKQHVHLTVGRVMVFEHSKMLIEKEGVLIGNINGTFNFGGVGFIVERRKERERRRID